MGWAERAASAARQVVATSAFVGEELHELGVLNGRDDGFPFAANASRVHPGPRRREHDRVRRDAAPAHTRLRGCDQESDPSDQ